MEQLRAVVEAEYHGDVMVFLAMRHGAKHESVHPRKAARGFTQCA